MSIFNPQSKFLARLGDPEIDGALTKAQMVGLYEDYATVKGITVVVNLLVKAGYVTVTKSAVCPKCDEELSFVVPPQDHRLVLTEVGAFRAKVLWSAMNSVGALDLLEEPPTQEEVNEKLDEVAEEMDDETSKGKTLFHSKGIKVVDNDAEKVDESEKTKITPYMVQQKRMRPGKCPVCRKGNLMKGACDACGWDEADGVECHGGLVKPLENTEICSKCDLYDHDKEQPCTWTKWVDE